MDLYIKQLKQEKDLLVERLRSHSFLKRCREGLITLNELKIFLVQQGLYATNFTKYLCATMSNLPSNAEIRPLAQNLFDEVGLSGTKPHAVIYGEMLNNFSLGLKNATPLSGTTTLIDAMFRNCRNPNPSFGSGALYLGAEALVPFFYGDIVQGFSEFGIREEHLGFFTLHIVVDEGHANDLRDIMISILTKKPEEIDNMVSAGKELVEARCEFFTSIEDAAQKLSEAG
jgi:pyrroloquinoline quinone (PQQ) biosynthesis protein C